MIKRWLASLGLVLGGCASPELPTMASVDLWRYQGDWHEIARLDHWFQRGCVQSTANYVLEADNTLRVTNRCITTEGKQREAFGRAIPVAGKPAQLKVSFGFPSNLFTGRNGNYWIIALDDDYQWVMVGHPDRQSLWILARTPVMDEEQYARLLAMARAQGFDVGKLLRP